MVRLTSTGTVVQQESYIDTFLSLPVRLYQMLMFFVMTLIDVRKASPRAWCDERAIPASLAPCFPDPPTCCAMCGAYARAAKGGEKGP